MSADFNIVITSLNAVKEELENVYACLDYNYDDFNDNQKSNINKIHSSIAILIKKIGLTLDDGSMFFNDNE